MQSEGPGEHVSSSLPASELLKPQAKDTLVDGFTLPDVSAPAPQG